jgi:hypothetical protein
VGASATLPVLVDGDLVLRFVFAGRDALEATEHTRCWSCLVRDAGKILKLAIEMGLQKIFALDDRNSGFPVSLPMNHHGR